MTAISNAIHRIDTEQVPRTSNVNELPQLYEPEEKEESSREGSFAELLAGLLRNVEKSPEIPVIENSFGEFGGDELEAGQKLTLLKETPFSETDVNVPAEDMNVLAGAQRLFTDLETVAAEANEGDFYQELSNLIKADAAPADDLESNFFDINAKNSQFKLDRGETLAALDASTMQNAAEANKKDRAQKVSIANENIDTLTGKKKHAEESVLRIRPENEKPGRLEEMRNAKAKGRDRLTFEVKDMRTGSAEAANSGRSFAAIEASVGSGRVGGEPAVREITLELRLPEQNNALNQANTSWEAKSSGALENLLARELHQNFNGDIVRHSSMALRDGGEGTIKIALKPESLGNVKIALELSDNKITGKIFVESEEALNAFRKEIASLEKEFRDAGFAAADLNLSLANSGQNAEGWDEVPFVPAAIASSYDNSSRMESESGVSLVNVFIGHRKSSINLLA